MRRVYSSVVERLTADQQVPGSNPGAPLFLRFCSSKCYAKKKTLLSAAKTYVVYAPDIAQLVERSTVDCAGIEWSLVRFRVSGFLESANFRTMEISKAKLVVKCASVIV